MTTERERRYIAALYEGREAVMAVADAEQAELRAEVERLCRALSAEENAHDRQVDRAADAEATVGRVEALLAELERKAKGADRMRRPSSVRWTNEAARLRAALDGDS